MFFYVPLFCSLYYLVICLWFTGLPKLTSLDVEGCNITADCLESISGNFKFSPSLKLLILNSNYYFPCSHLIIMDEHLYQFFYRKIEDLDRCNTHTIGTEAANSTVLETHVDYFSSISNFVSQFVIVYSF